MELVLEMKDSKGNKIPVPSRYSTWMGLIISFFLMLALTILKLIGWISWSWWIILIPIWVPVAIWALAGIAAGILIIFFGAGDKTNND